MHAEKTDLDIPQILARLPLFLELSAEQLAHIASHTREKRLKKNDILFQKGDASHGFYVVVFGQIKLAFSSSQGNEKVISILGPRQSFGEAAMFLDRPYPVFAEALADTLLLHIAQNVVFEQLECDALFARRMLAGISMRLHSLVQDVESYSLRSSTQRVIGFLLQHCESAEAKKLNAQEIAFTLPTSKQVIASRLNLTPETLSRIFHDLASAKLISVQGKQITVHGMKPLREFDL